MAVLITAFGTVARGAGVEAVVGGEPSSAAEARGMAAIVGDDGDLYCAGTVIAPRWVLTAGHCVEYMRDVSVPLNVATGRLDFRKLGVGEERGIAAMYLHPRYKQGGSFKYDVALLELDGPLSEPTVQLAQPEHAKFERPGTPAQVVGWGTTRVALPVGNLSGPVSPVLRTVEVPVVSDLRCAVGYQLLSLWDSDIQLCAAGLLRDSCFGDSGGPLFAHTGRGRVQIGIVSFGLGCGIPTHPGVYTEVNSAPIANWIRATVTP
jgi:trypsin